jgi:hypothetical protein
MKNENEKLPEKVVLFKDNTTVKPFLKEIHLSLITMFIFLEKKDDENKKILFCIDNTSVQEFVIIKNNFDKENQFKIIGLGRMNYGTITGWTSVSPVLNTSHVVAAEIMSLLGTTIMTEPAKNKILTSISSVA